MSDPRGQAFAGFVATSAAPLLTCLVESLQATLSIVDAEGSGIFETTSPTPSPGPTASVAREIDPRWMRSPGPLPPTSPIGSCRSRIWIV